MSWEFFVNISEQCFLIEGDKEIYPVNVRVNIAVRGPDAVVTVFALNVRVVLDIGEDMKAASSAGLCKRLRDRVNAASLWAPYDPCQVILLSQSSFLRYACGLSTALLGLRGLKVVLWSIPARILVCCGYDIQGSSTCPPELAQLLHDEIVAHQAPQERGSAKSHGSFFRH